MLQRSASYSGSCPAYSLLRPFSGLLSSYQSAHLFLWGGGITLFSIVGFIYPIIFETRLPWALDCSLMATFFYGLGWILRKTPFERSLIYLNNNRVRIILTIVVLFALGILISLTNGEVNMRTTKYGNYFLYISAAVIMSAAWMLFSSFLNSLEGINRVKKMFTWFGQNTLVVLLLNSTCVRAWEVISEKILTNCNQEMVYSINILVAFAITIICCLLSELIIRYIPWILGKRKV